jgi:hypothetical protein
MSNTSPKLRVCGWAGTVLGASLTGLGLLVPGELSGLIGGYGLMTLGAALYLVAGLRLRDALAGRNTAAQHITAPSPSSPIRTTVSRP